MPRDPKREIEEVAQVFSALANASRRHILLVLHFHSGQMTAGEIAARFDCSWPTTTRHLRQLEAAGLVRVEKSGRERVYQLQPERLEKTVGGWLDWFDAPRRNAAGRARRRPPSGPG